MSVYWWNYSTCLCPTNHRLHICQILMLKAKEDRVTEQIASQNKEKKFNFTLALPSDSKKGRQQE